MIFHSLDDEKDGELEIKELVEQLKEKFDITVRLSEMEQILRHVDLDFDGKVQFTEFLIAGCNKRSLFTQHNIEKCFRVLDIDEDEEISCNDL